MGLLCCRLVFFIVECLDSGITCQVIWILRGWRMRILLLQSLIPAQKSFTVTTAAIALCLSSVPHWNLGSDSRRCVWYRNQHCSGTKPDATFRFPSQFRRASTINPQINNFFKIKLHFLMKTMLPSYCWWLLGANLVFYFRFHHLHRRQEDAGREAVCGDCVSLWHQSVFIWWECVFT